MVEGHGVHRVAEAHKKILLGQVCLATSPNGRFEEGAKKINRLCLKRIEAHGKNLFYFFGKGHATIDEKRKSMKRLENSKTLYDYLIHIHFGMSGQFTFVPYPETEQENVQPQINDTRRKSGEKGKIPKEKVSIVVPDLTTLNKHVKPTTRLQLLFPEVKIALHLSCQTLEWSDQVETIYNYWITEKLGPDPLRSFWEDGLDDNFYKNLRNYSTKSIGQALMDQKVIAGVGNIFRAEILFRSKIHPLKPCSSLSIQEMQAVWENCVSCLRKGFETGSIITVDKADAKRLGPPWERRYIYNHSHCGECLGKVKSWKMNGRTCYCCENCQQLHTPQPASDISPQVMSNLKNQNQLASDQMEVTPPPKDTDIILQPLTPMHSRVYDFNLTTPPSSRLSISLNAINSDSPASNTRYRKKKTKSLILWEVSQSSHVHVLSPPQTPSLKLLTVFDLKMELKARKLSTSGRKPELLKRLELALNSEENEHQDTRESLMRVQKFDEKDDSDFIPDSPTPQRKKIRFFTLDKQETETMASLNDTHFNHVNGQRNDDPLMKNTLKMEGIFNAQREKEFVNEKKNVEHIALTASVSIVNEIDEKLKG